MNLVEIMNRPDSDNAAVLLARRIAAYERRTAALERRVTILEGRVLVDGPQAQMADRARDYSWGNNTPEPYHHRQDLAGAIRQAAPWISTSVRFAESLTSTGHTRAMALQSCLMAASMGGVASLIAWRLELPPLGTAGAVAVVSFALTFTTLLIVNRTDVHQLVRQQGSKSKNAQHRVQIDYHEGHSTDFLYLKHDVDREDLRQLAQAVLKGKSLAVHGWVGVGGWTRTKYDNVMAELEALGYVRPGRGNIPRATTAKGRALFRSWAE